MTPSSDARHARSASCITRAIAQGVTHASGGTPTDLRADERGLVAVDRADHVVHGDLGGRPRRGVVELAGPQALGLDEVLRRVLTATGDRRRVVGDPDAGYLGTAIDERTLTAAPGTRQAPTTLDDRLARRPVDALG